MRILAISDEERAYYWDHYRPGRLDGIDLILSCGDLRAEYLSFLVTMANRPLLYVHGNHDGGYRTRPPEGCDCIDDRLVTVNGVRILGLGGCPFYSGEGFQYTERQMERRIARLRLQLRRAGGVDIVLTHAPVRGCGDAEDYAHRGFQAFRPLLEKYRPAYLVHGHVHLRYGAQIARETRCGDTTLLNACGSCIFEFPDRK